MVVSFKRAKVSNIIIRRIILMRIARAVTRTRRLLQFARKANYAVFVVIPVAMQTMTTDWSFCEGSVVFALEV